MARLLALLLLASLGACARRDGGAALEARLRRAPTTAITALTAEGWRKRLAEFSRGAGGGGALDPKVFTVPLQGDSCGRGSLSVLMVQVPAQCEAPPACPRPPGVVAPDGTPPPPSPPPSYGPPHPPQPSRVVTPDGAPPPPPYDPSHPPQPPRVVAPTGAPPPPPYDPPHPPQPSRVVTPDGAPPPPPYDPPHPPQPPRVVAPTGAPPPPPYDPSHPPQPPRVVEPPQNYGGVYPTWPPPPSPPPFVPPYGQPNPTWPPGVEPPPPPPFVPPYGQPNPTLPPHSNYSAPRSLTPPSFPPVEDSGVLVQKFLDQLGEQPQLPPVVIDPVGPVGTDDYTVEEWSPNSVVWRRRQYKKRCMPLNTTETKPPPPQPRFPRSLYIRANLTVPRADYTEPYEVRWDAETGAARIDYHGGTASSYRQIVGDVVYRHMLVLDRTGESNVRRCTDHQSRASKADRELPALPNLEVFSFAGRDVHGNEVWRHTASGHSGELGAARGEQLTFRHELLLKRSADQYTTIPLRYSVRVDSSLLGPDCDGYIHQFDKVEIEHHHPSILHLSHEACDYREWTDKMETVEPLREFTSLHRAQHHDVDFKRYMETYTRLYADDTELATRKNIFIQNSRFVASANRQGASFELELNFLSDRLTEERRVVLGVEPNFSTDSPCKPFPHSPSEINANRGRLSRTFDWRELGAVTHVRFQGTTCMSCWAHATVGALEGALFRVTNRLVPLSEQVLVDCAKPYGGNGCSGTWPTAAYEYMKAEGIPALTDYPYEGKEQLCRANSVRPVQRTHISTHVNVTINNIVALKMAISKYGPTVVIIDGETLSFTTYKRGYYYDGRCRKGKFNHAVLAVGWTVHREETYFILKNSWSENWGEAGYVLMRAPTNTCGVLQQPTVPVLPQETELLG